MGGRKTEYKEDEIAIFEDACVYKRGDYWQFRLWLEKEKKYVRKSLRTRKRTEAVELGKELYLELFADMKQGKSYYSITSEKAAEKYLAAGISEQRLLAENPNYTQISVRTVADDSGDVREVEVGKRVLRWWRVGADGRVELTIRYGSRVLEVAKGMDAVELASADDLVGVLEQAAAERGEMDDMVAVQLAKRKRVNTQKQQKLS